MEQPTRNQGLAAWKWLLLPWMIAFTCMAYYWAKPLRAFQDPETARIIFWHVPMAWLAMIWFFVGAYHAYRFLYGSSAGDMERDRKVDIASQIGLICTVVATVTGSIFASRQWGTAWNWDPKEVMITVLIVVYLAYFGLRMSIETEELRARLSAVYAMLGAVIAPFLMYVIPNLPQVSKLHPPGQTITNGLDAKWRIIYLTALVGFTGITIWIFQLRLRFAALELGARSQGSAGTGSELPGGPGAPPRRTEAVRQPVLKG